VQRPQSADRKNNTGFPRVVGAGGRGGLPGFVTKQDPTLPIVEVGEPDAVGELENGDDLLRHDFSRTELTSAFRWLQSCLKLETPSIGYGGVSARVNFWAAGS
jgi:hypothetical protein